MLVLRHECAVLGFIITNVGARQPPSLPDLWGDAFSRERGPVQVKAHRHDLIDAAPSKSNSRAYVLAGTVLFAIVTKGFDVLPDDGVPAAGNRHGYAAGALGCRCAGRWHIPGEAHKDRD